MGLDVVEMVMEVEDHFRISLSDEDCSRVRSVSDLAGLVAAELSKFKLVCPTARSFFALRRTAASVTQLERNELRPRTSLDLVTPRSQRRRVWRRLRSANPIVPGLVPSVGARSFLRTFGWILCVGWIAGTVALIDSQGGSGSALGLLLGFVMAAISIWTSNHLSTEFPDGCASLGDLARRITPLPPPEGDPGAERRILDDIRRITAEQAGCKVGDVKPESRFVDDLGMD